MRLFPPGGKSRQMTAAVPQSYFRWQNHFLESKRSNRIHRCGMRPGIAKGPARPLPPSSATGHNCKNPFMLLAFTPSAKTDRPPSAGERRNESTTCAPALRLHRKTAYASREREPAKEG